MRNRITHSFISIDTGLLMRADDEEYLLMESELFDKTNQMFIIAKAAIMYTIQFLNSEAAKFSGMSIEMAPVMQDEIYGD